jgi:sulfite reductase (NADPH) flavoprotein alpha-component
VFGWPGRLAFMLAAAAMPLFAVTGLLLYLSRRRHRRLAREAQMRLVPGE